MRWEWPRIFRRITCVKWSVNLQRLVTLIDLLERPDLCYPVFIPALPKALKDEKTIFETLGREDHLLLHPYQSFAPVVDLLRQAARDPQVVAIKQTLYRTGESSELVELLAEAARNGKEVAVVIELRARFDEEENLRFANILQEAGALVMYGVVGHNVNFTARIESATEGGQILISENTHDLCNGLLEIRGEMSVRPKGFDHDVRLFDVFGIGGGYAKEKRIQVMLDFLFKVKIKII